jgi:hypothetical protein
MKGLRNRGGEAWHRGAAWHGPEIRDSLVQQGRGDGACARAASMARSVPAEMESIVVAAAESFGFAGEVEPSEARRALRETRMLSHRCARGSRRLLRNFTVGAALPAPRSRDTPGRSKHPN